MGKLLKKILVLLPVLVITFFFLRLHYDNQYKNAPERRLLALVITVMIFYFWIIIDLAKREQQDLFQYLIQSSFYVYIFSVLTLTGYFILFKEVSAHDWWEKMLMRVSKRKGVNLTLFYSIKHYGYFAYQVLGNVAMLLPLGIYLPLLYKRLQHFLPVVFTCMLVSISIELMQLVTNFRVTDVDDVFLNTLGAGIGFLVFKIIAGLLPKNAEMPRLSRL